MSNSFDRIARFLTSPQAKVKYYNDQNVELLLKKNLNSLAEKTEFRARIIGIPRVGANSSYTIFNEQTESMADELVYVRLDDIDEYFLPNPVSSRAEGQGLIDIILAHPLAVVSPEVGGNSIKLGDIVLCSFAQNPGNDGKQRGLRVIKILDTTDSDQWRAKMTLNLRSNGLLELASAFEAGGAFAGSRGPDNRPDFAGNYGAAPAPVKVFLDDLVRIIKKEGNYELLPINVGSLYRSRGKQASIMWNNVVNGANAERMAWFDKTYKPNNKWKSTVLAATVGKNYGFTAPSSSDRDKGGKIRKYMQYEAKLILQGGLDDEINQTKGVADITKIYDDYYTKYQVLPSRHNVGEAVDIRTVYGSRADIAPKGSYPEYTLTDKSKIIELVKKSVYYSFVQIESANKSGEHIHVNVKKE